MSKYFKFDSQIKYIILDPIKQLQYYVTDSYNDAVELRSKHKDTIIVEQYTKSYLNEIE